MQAKNTICLTFQRGAEEAARFYTSVFPDSAMGQIQYAPSDYPGGKQGDALVVHFTVAGIPCIALNGGDFPGFVPTMAFSFQIATDSQKETDRYWNAIIDNGGKANACGWCQDRWGMHWQITPRVLTDALAAGGEVAARAFAAMQGMMKIDVAAIESAIEAAMEGAVQVSEPMNPDQRDLFAEISEGFQALAQARTGAGSKPPS